MFINIPTYRITFNYITNCVCIVLLLYHRAGPRQLAARLKTTFHQQQQQQSSSYTSEKSASKSQSRDHPFLSDPDDADDHLDPIYRVEEAIITSLTTVNLLLIFDHANSLLSSSADTAADFRMFIGRLLERSKKLKVYILFLNIH